LTGEPFYYGIAQLTGEYYIPVTEEVALEAGEEGERVVRHPISDEPLVRLDWWDDGYPGAKDKVAASKAYLSTRIRADGFN
jgi:hypothetical protein